ncbi:MAG: alpha/beta hydrolase [Gammaproteobacteria bacterium]|nr:alpha/beta hydrolase [Gammaproteobacteria bacterium]
MPVFIGCIATRACASIESMSDELTYRPAVPRRTLQQPVRDASYALHEWGDAGAPLLLYLHGWGDCGSTFQFVVDALQKEWRVVAPDWRGFGRTRIDCSSYWFPDYLADLHMLAEHLSPEEPLRLVGHSMGGNIASLYAGIMPERVRALVNIEGLGLPDSDSLEAPQRYRDWIEQLDARPRFSEYPDFEALATHLKKRNPRLSAAAAAFVAREWASRGADGVVTLRADPAHKLPNPILYRRAEAVACWQRTTADVLQVSGAQSRLMQRYGAALDDMFPHARRTNIEDAGHMLHWEAPAVLAAAIEEFLLPTL